MLRRIHFRATINQNDIMRYPLKKAPATITYSIDFEEHEARIHAGLSLKEYNDLPGDPAWCTEQFPVSKAEILVSFRLHYQILAVQDDIAAKKKR